MTSSTAVTITPTATIAPVATATPVAVQSIVAQPNTINPTLASQIGHVDPLVWTALLGTLVVPFIHQLIKRVVKALHDPKHRTTNYAIAGLLSVLVGVLTDLQNSGALSRLHNPLLATALSAALSFTLGQQVYGFVVKTNEQQTVLDSLPVVTEP